MADSPFKFVAFLLSYHRENINVSKCICALGNSCTFHLHIFATFLRTCERSDKNMNSWHNAQKAATEQK